MPNQPPKEESQREPNPGADAGIEPPSAPASAALHHKAPLGLRTVAIYEFVKGLLVLVVGLGLLSLIHKDVQVAAENMLKAFHVDPAWHYSQMLIEASASLTDTRIRLIALAAMLYAAIRFLETYGLWHERHWAEWFAVISASLYLPVEVFHFSRHPTFLRAGLFFANLAIVIYLAWILRLNHRRKVALKSGA